MSQHLPPAELPVARIVRCDLVIREREPDIPASTVIAVGIPLLAFLFALVIPALNL